MDTSNTLRTRAKTCAFLIKNDEVWEKYEQIWDVMKNKLGIKFHRELFSKQKYLKAKIREFNGVIIPIFLGNDMPKENMYSTSIACIIIHSVMRIDKKPSTSLFRGMQIQNKENTNI